MAKTEIIKDVSGDDTKAVEKKILNKVNPAIIVLVVVILIFVIPPTAYLLLSGKKVQIMDSKETTTESTCKCEECKQEECPVLKDKEECKCPTQTQNVQIVNSDWAIITVPKIRLSMEIPSSEVVKNMFQDKELESSWSFKYMRKLEYPTEGLGTFVGGIKGSFYPSAESLKGVACGGNGCANVSYVNVDVYNNGNKTQAQVLQTYKATLNGDESTIEVKQITKWGIPVYEFIESYLGNEEKGYLLVKNGLTYRISYYAASEPKYMSSEVNKIIDFIKFN